MTRATLTAAFLLAVVLVWLLMWRGWRARAGRQAGIAEPAAPHGDPTGEPFDGVYVSTTRHGDWLDRVVAHGLGTRSEVRAWVGADGVVLERTGARSLLIPAADVGAAGRSSGMAGKVVERDGLAVITWRLGDEQVDTGLRMRRSQDTAVLVAAVNALAAGGEQDGKVEA